MSALRRNSRKDCGHCRKICNVHRISSSGRAVSVDAAYLHHPLMLSRDCREMLTDSSSPGISPNNGAQNWVQMGCGSLRAKRRRHQPPWRSVSETSARKLKLTVKKRSQSIYNFRIILLNILCYFTFQEPPLSGPSFDYSLSFQLR